METIDIFRFVASFLFVIGLIVLCAWMAKRWNLFSQSAFGAQNRRLGLIETLHVDGKRKLVIVKRDDVEHALLLGPTGDLVIESGIAAPQTSKEEANREPLKGDQAGSPSFIQDAYSKIARIK